MGEPSINTDEALAQAAGDFYDDPLGFVLTFWPWGQPGRLEQFTGPDQWQVELLTWLGDEVRARGFNGKDAVLPIRKAVSSGHGIGKSTLAAFVIHWVMATRPYTKGVVTATTETQLSARLWAAVDQWYRLSPLLPRWFDINTERLFHRKHKTTWFIIPQTCKEENSDAFAGQHAIDSTPLYIFDEASGVPDKIYEVAEGGLTDGEPIMLLFGNMTRAEGRFYECCFGKFRELWNPIRVDSRASAFSNKQLIQQWADYYGEDSDFFRVRVQGLPPQQATIQFIDELRIRQAQSRPVEVLPDEPLLCGLDCSRGGADATVFRYRCGMDASTIPPLRIHGGQTRDATLLVTTAVRILEERHNGRLVEMLFIDSSNVGGAIYDRLRQLGHERRIAEVAFSGESPLRRYANMRAYMWGQMRDWLVRGSIDTGQFLFDDLKGPQYHHNKRDRIVLEDKKAMKLRGLASPDDGDALGLTFAQPVVARLRRAESARKAANRRQRLNEPGRSPEDDHLEWMA